MMATHKRRLMARGKWMDLINPEVLRAFINAKPGMNQSKLSEYAGCSRQFISQLLSGDRDSCTPKLAIAIEDVLGAPRGTIFSPKKSDESLHKVNERRSSGVPRAGKLRVA